MRIRRALIVPLLTWLACLHASRSSGFDGTGADGGRLELCADHWSRTIRVEGHLARVVDDAWHRSPTFRRQWARIAAEAPLVVTLGYCFDGCPSSTRARTVLTSAGGLLRRAEIRVNSFDPRELVEVIAHEFEHILEQLDGADLPTLAAQAGRHGHGVQDVGNGHYETQRAHRTGLMVAVEFTGRAGASFSCSSVQ